MLQLCTNIPWGMPMDMTLITSLVSMIPKEAFWSCFAIGRMQMPMAAGGVYWAETSVLD
jgi:uncharacterized protein (DUF849 family)